MVWKTETVLTSITTGRRIRGCDRKPRLTAKAPCKPFGSTISKKAQLCSILEDSRIISVALFSIFSSI